MVEYQRDNMLIPLLLLLSASFLVGNELKVANFISPKFDLSPGSVKVGYFFDIDFPKGHIAVKSFKGQIVDEHQNPVPLHEAYVHHWAVERYFQRRGAPSLPESSNKNFRSPDYIYAGNSGICQGTAVSQHFAVGSETRGTYMFVPDPYGIVLGNQDEIPDGYEEKWMINIHAIDTRGVVDKLKCIECHCDVYNVTRSEDGLLIPENYRGGIICCYDKTQCKLTRGFRGSTRTLFLRYSVKWINWAPSVLPVKIFMFDITDTGKRTGNNDLHPENGCQVEYDVVPCNSSINENACVHNKKTGVSLPSSGHFIYGVGHQHAGGIGTTLYGEDGRVICNSVPIYGQSEEVGDEAGYIVGMTTCYPKPGSMKIYARENLILESRYNNTQIHVGVMGLFYFLIAEEVQEDGSDLNAIAQINDKVKIVDFSWIGLALGFGAGMMLGLALQSFLRRDEAYIPIDKYKT